MERIKWENNIVENRKYRKIENRKPRFVENKNSDVHKRLDKSIDNKYKGETAWIFGSGASLNDIESWETSLINSFSFKTIALNGAVVWFWNHGKPVVKSGTADANNYRNRLDYWFTFDKRVVNPKRQPEWNYCNMALRHPTATKYITHWMPDFEDCPNVVKYILRKRKDNEVIDKPFDGKLITGDSILSPVLHWCYLAGFKRIYLSGIDLCLVKKARYFKGLADMPTRGSHISGYGRYYIAPNGERVMHSSMYQKQLFQILPVIRFMQDHGVEFYKTSLSGMLPINAITNQKTMIAIEKGESLKHA